MAETGDLMTAMTAEQMRQTGEAIASVQLNDGCIPWFENGPADPWDHIEAAMALDAVGLHREAERAYQWLTATQEADGSWAARYQAGAVVDPTRDANFCAYAAAGAWHHFLATGDSGFLEAFWPTLERAMVFVLDLQAPGGEILWARSGSGAAWPKALLASSSCIHLSLRCAIEAAGRLHRFRPDWEEAVDALAYAIAHRPQAFEDKRRWSMDWYYPILGGVVSGSAAMSRVADGWDAFVVEGLGVRCVSDRPWVTVAETCELVLALDAIGHPDAPVLFAGFHHLRDEAGHYWTGITFPEAEIYPEEKPTWTSAAVILAGDALSASSSTSGFFRGPWPALPGTADVVG